MHQAAFQSFFVAEWIQIRMEIWLVKVISFLGHKSQQNFDQPYLNEYLDSCGHKKMAQSHKIPLNSARNSVFTILYQQKICKHKVG